MHFDIQFGDPTLVFSLGIHFDIQFGDPTLVNQFQSWVKWAILLLSLMNPRYAPIFVG